MCPSSPWKPEKKQKEDPKCVPEPKKSHSPNIAWEEKSARQHNRYMVLMFTTYGTLQTHCSVGFRCSTQKRGVKESEKLIFKWYGNNLWDIICVLIRKESRGNSALEIINLRLHIRSGHGQRFWWVDSITISLCFFLTFFVLSKLSVHYSPKQNMYLCL